jgi:GT2 family glycosyltransferase
MTNTQSAKWPLVSIIIPVYNGLKFLPVSLPSVLALDYPDLEITVIDDHSTDGTETLLSEKYPALRVIRHERNRGLDYSFNEGFRLATGKYVFYVNQDTVYQPDYLKICVERLEADSSLAAVTGKTYKYDFANRRASHIIDSAGILIFKNRRVLDRGQGEEDQGQYEKAGRVFGVSGHNPIYRRSALSDVAVPVPGRPDREVFDEDFFMYKEDVDLAWRLQLFGWSSFYEPCAVAWHGRATSAVKRSNYLEILRNRGKLSSLQKYHSIKNRYLMQLKNELCSLYFRDFFRIWWNDLLYFGYNLGFNTRSIGAYFAALALFPKMWKKRRWIMKNRKVKARDLRKWFKTK